MATTSKSKSLKFTTIHASSKVFQSSNLLLAIIHYLPPLDYGRACIVDRQWNETIDRCHEIWKRHKVKRWPDCKDMVNGMRVTRRGMTAKDLFSRISMSFLKTKSKKSKDKAASPRVVKDEFKDVFMRIQVDDERDGRRIASAVIPLDNDHNLEGLFLKAKSVPLRLAKKRKKAPLPDSQHWKATAAIVDLRRNLAGTAIEAKYYEFCDFDDEPDDITDSVYSPRQSSSSLDWDCEGYYHSHYLRLHKELEYPCGEDGEVDYGAQPEVVGMRASIRILAEDSMFEGAADCDFEEFFRTNEVRDHVRRALKQL